MKAAVIYYTFTGHSRRIAEAIGRALNIPCHNVKKSPELKEVELLYIVGGIYSGQSHPNLLKYIETLKKESVKEAVLITSCASKDTGQDKVRRLLDQKGIPVRDEFICQGSFLFNGRGHPDQTDIRQATDFARKYLDRAAG